MMRSMQSWAALAGAAVAAVMLLFESVTGLMVWLLVLTMCAIGWWKLSHCAPREA